MSPERDGLRTRESDKILRPSLELSWILGVLSGGGYVGTSPNWQIRVKTIRNPELLTEFRVVGQTLFGKKPDAKPNYVLFNSKQIAQEIGDLRNTVWTETIQRRHRWILEDINFTWKFIEGLFDTKAHLETKPDKSRNTLVFRTRNFASADFIKKLLLDVGIRKPTMYPREQPKKNDIYTLYTVGVYNIEDLKVIADNIHPKSPEKQDKLKAIKQLSDPPTAEDLYFEWKRLGMPSSYKLVKLYREGKTNFSRSVYERVFGGEGFTKAIEELKKMYRSKSYSRAFRILINDDERQIWTYAIEHNLMEKIIKAGKLTPQKLDLIKIFFGSGILPEGLTEKDFNILSIEVAKYA